MSEKKRVIVANLGDFGLFIFLSICVVTCGWSPNCGETPRRAQGL